MALLVADPNAVKPNHCSNPPRKVRIIAKIRGLTPRESESLTQDSKPWITIKNPEEESSSEKCKVFFETPSTRLSNSSIKKRETPASNLSRKDGYELDYCYEQLEEIDHIYSREIQPLVLELFEGRNSSIIALGAKGSGKTYTIQGSQEKPGLAVMAMSEIIAKAKELDKSVSVSLYELTQEHVKDLLNPDHPVIQVLDDAHGKVIIKGLSKVPVNSMIEFHDLYFSLGSSHNTQKVAIDQSHHTDHRGLMVHISDDNMKAKLANKINFVDLAGYSREGITTVENNKKNRSLYALLNVVSSLSTSEQRVPYRESKLTRLLQDSLGGRSHVLLLTCLNPCFCPDSLSSISLVSRSYRSIQKVLTDSTNISESSAKMKVLPSFGSGKAMSASLSAKKHIGHGRALSTTKDSHILKGRNLFNEVKKVTSKQLRCQSEDTSCHKSKILPSLALVVAPFSLEEAPQDKYISECSSSVEQIEDVNSEAPGPQSMSKLENTPSAITDDPTILMKTDSKLNELEGTLGAISDRKVQTQSEAGSTCEENKYLYKKGDGSPSLSERIREISNNLKSLSESTPLTIKMPKEIATPCSNQVSYNDNLEPKTPAMEPNSARYCSPQGTFNNRSSKLKHSLVKEYLSFFNSANKEELKKLKGIGEKRATYIMEMREESPEPFKSLDDLQDIGLSANQIKGMMKQVAGGLFEQII
ncbi:hypothetical protein C2S51_038650 [Perilla frutescens var. frutescens]|nr:hypothetical protein C2S51_038650 [Perilla frutescens var. frutescens]